MTERHHETDQRKASFKTPSFFLCFGVKVRSGLPIRSSLNPGMALASFPAEDDSPLIDMKESKTLELKFR